MGAPPFVVMSVPENVAKKQQAQAKIAAEAATANAAAKQARKEKRVAAYNNAAKYAKEYRALAKQRVRMHRQAKAAGNRGLADMHPKTKKILQIMRLRQMNMGVFIKVSKAATEMLKRVEPYLSYGYPNLKSVRELIYKRGFGKINKQRLPLNDNSVIETALGKHGIVCMEDLVHEIYTVGPHFKQANKRKGFCEGGQAGNREDKINALVQKML